MNLKQPKGTCYRFWKTQNVVMEAVMVVVVVVMGFLCPVLLVWVAGCVRACVSVCVCVCVCVQATDHSWVSCLHRWNSWKCFQIRSNIFCLNFQQIQTNQNHVAISHFCYVPKFASLHVFLFGVWNNRVEYQVRNQQSDYVLALAFTNMLNSGHTSLSCKRHLSCIDPYPKSDTMALWRAINCSEFCEFCYLTILKGYAPN